MIGICQFDQDKNIICRARRWSTSKNSAPGEGESVTRKNPAKTKCHPALGQPGQNSTVPNRALQRRDLHRFFAIFSLFHKPFKGSWCNNHKSIALGNLIYWILVSVVLQIVKLPFDLAEFELLRLATRKWPVSRNMFTPNSTRISNYVHLLHYCHLSYLHDD